MYLHKDNFQRPGEYKVNHFVPECRPPEAITDPQFKESHLEFSQCFSFLKTQLPSWH